MAVAVIGASLLAACSETVLIRSVPSGAKLMVNDTNVGVTPVDFKASRSEMTNRHLHYRLEEDGYMPAEGELPVRVSAGRIVGTVFTAGILAAFKGFHVFQEDEMTFGLAPSAWTSPTGAATGSPGVQKIFITTAPLSSLPPGSYVWIKDIEISRNFYGNYTGLLDEMAVEARSAGADAVFELEKHSHVGMVAWAVPQVIGKAVAVKDPCALTGISGEVYPRGEADTPQNRPITARCTKGTGAGQSAAPSGETAAGTCTVEQVLAMKNAGLTDQQIKAACTK